MSELFDDPDFAQDDDCNYPGVTCNRCGKTGLEWGTPARGKFTLFNEVGKPHQCNAAILRKQVIAEFSDLTEE